MLTRDPQRATHLADSPFELFRMKHVAETYLAVR